ncbi:hypothetical protein [Mesorhizobium sp. Z1-4]|uniref:hypothetical protein n=1 Tax=Mesorhizobium sp. Z1-4 TaxID=2448478 RepID=UPI000FD7E270|nr:hypothetical protein [Mesorhizobium sp. Z1-4]
MRKTRKRKPQLRLISVSLRSRPKGRQRLKPISPMELLRRERMIEAQMQRLAARETATWLPRPMPPGRLYPVPATPGQWMVLH